MEKKKRKNKYKLLCLVKKITNIKKIKIKRTYTYKYYFAEKRGDNICLKKLRKNTKETVN